jgi:hypothetical protein
MYMFGVYWSGFGGVGWTWVVGFGAVVSFLGVSTFTVTAGVYYGVVV